MAVQKVKLVEYAVLGQEFRITFIQQSRVDAVMARLAERGLKCSVTDREVDDETGKLVPLAVGDPVVTVHLHAE